MRPAISTVTVRTASKVMGFRPFLIPVLWAIIIAVAIHPLYVKFESLLGGKQKLALSLFTIIALAILIIPSILLASSTVDTVQQVSKRLAEGTLQAPPPDSVAGISTDTVINELQKRVKPDFSPSAPAGHLVAWRCGSGHPSGG